MSAEREDPKLRELLEARDRLNNRIRRRRRRGEREEGKRLTRRKILLGAWLLHRHGDDLPVEIVRELDRFLTRDRDRALFGLSPATKGPDSL